MTEPQWQHIEVPRGAFISWGEQPGVQEVVGRLVDYAPTGGTDFQGNACPQLTVELRAPTFSVNKAGQRTDHAAGDLVVLNCGLVSLKRGVQVLAAQAKPGDLVKISFARTQQVTNGVVKEFDVSWAPGSPTMNGAGQQAPAQQQAPPPPQSWQQPQPQPPPPPQSWQQQPPQQPPQQPWQQPQQQPVYAQAAPQAPQAPVPPGGAWGSQQAEPPF